MSENRSWVLRASPRVSQPCRESREPVEEVHSRSQNRGSRISPKSENLGFSDRVPEKGVDPNVSAPRGVHECRSPAESLESQWKRSAVASRGREEAREVAAPFRTHSLSQGDRRSCRDNFERANLERGLVAARCVRLRADSELKVSTL